ncbi:NUDIX domain-containing protein [Sphingomonas parva]|uniref:NUDIX domain-containing protein n=1 Tax=Sphingomonas parva TaxID=2555898 RepID=A0A4Y8ZK90_9SPHN|nr:NUDIX domain-containing protein [Sphingomonas parva]TFI56420.1 NUDIX domain-containing protein [Sphingomonas parva]
MKPLLNLAFRIRQRLWRIFRPRTRGVKAMLFNAAGEIVLIRNTYGRSDMFVLPGGGIRPFEEPRAAARREVREELGCAVFDLEPVSTHVSGAEGRKDTIYLFRGTIAGEPVPDRFEVAEAATFPLDRLPETVSPATLRRIDEHLGRRVPDGAW